MAMLGSIGRIFKPIVSSVVKAVAPKALEALKGLAGKGISSLFEAGAKGLQGLVSKLPFGSAISNLIGKLAPGLQEKAQGWASGLLDKLLGRIMGQPTSRPVPGAPAGTTVTPPPLTQRGPDIAANTPNSNTNASTGSNGGSSVGNSGGSSTAEGAAPSSLGWSGGAPDPAKYKMDTPEGAANFQKDNLKYQQAMNNIQMYYSTLSNQLSAMASLAKQIGQNVKI
jgi:hypothetical protein